MKIYLIYLLIFSFWIECYAKNHKITCILPSPDASEESKPSLVGIVKSIDKTKLLLQPLSKDNLVEIDLSDVKKINIFSTFGGIVKVHEIEIENKIELWSKDCQKFKSKKIKPYAVRVHIK